MFMFGTKIDKKIRAARPNLFKLAPLTYTISWIFVPFNAGIGTYLIHARDTLTSPIVNDILTAEVWGGIFIGLGIVLALALLFNSWAYTRHAMVAGLFVKAFWAYALVVLAFNDGFWAIMPSLVMWLTIASIQAAVVIYFLPVGAIRIRDGSANE